MVKLVGMKETCVYKEMNYYAERCNDCSGRNVNKLCYVTRNELNDSLDRFSKLFKILVPIDEEALDLKFETLDFIDNPRELDL
jgi:hypothetical protein